MRKIIIIGASSGIGKSVAELFAKKGWTVGIAARRTDKLDEIKNKYPSQVSTAMIDVNSTDAPNDIRKLIDAIGGADVIMNVAGIGKQNPDLTADIETATAETNVLGFIRTVTTAFNYFKAKGGGHIAVISSIAGTKGLGAAPAYSATKRLQNTYIDALDQLSRMQKLNIRFTDIRPGFVNTDLLNGEQNYPMLMNVEHVAKAAVNAIERQKRVAVIDWRYRILTAIWSVIPRCLWVRLNIRTNKRH